MMKRITWTNLMVAALVVGLGTSGCSEDSGSEDAGTDIVGTSETSVRAIHLSDDAPAVDLYVDGERVVSVDGLAFGFGTDYLTIPAGTHSVDIVPAGGTLEDSVLSAEVELAMDAWTTIAAVGTASELQALLLSDDPSDLAEGDIRIRPIHAATDVGTVDIWNIPMEGEAQELYSGVGFGVTGAYIDLPAGAYTLGFDVDADMNPDVFFEIPALPAGTVANVFAVSDESGVYLLAQTLDSTIVKIDAKEEEVVEPEMASIRAIHLSSDAPSVDIFVNDGMDAAFSILAYGEGTNYAELEAGTYDFDVAPTGMTASDSVLPIDGLILSEGGFYTAVAYDTLENGIKALLLMDDYSDVAEGDIRVRAIHTAWSVGSVDIWNIPIEGTPGKLYDNVPFGETGHYIDLPAGAYTLGFDIDEDMNPDVIFEVPSLPAGTVANVFAVSDSEGGVSLKAQLSDGSVATVSPSL